MAKRRTAEAVGNLDGFEETDDERVPLRTEPVIGDAVHYYGPRAAGLWGAEARKPQPATITDVHEGDVVDLVVLETGMPSAPAVLRRVLRVPQGEDGDVERWCWPRF